ncbi:MAG: hypothetical protein PHF72_08635 [Gammaproteobacteria bacterium]|nr:hypothetical protein [Gammaproteobacteria bacterium]
MATIDTLYHREDGFWLIELEISDARQLFNSLDPAPFREKDLDSEAEQYIVGAAREFHLDAPLKLVIHLPGAAAGSEAARSTPDAIRHYFAYRAEVKARELRNTLREGRTALLIGLSFLFLCIGARRFVGLLSDDTLAGIVEEGLLISGWVAMWRPIEIFLYLWWPIRRTRQVLRKLSLVPVEIRPR